MAKRFIVFALMFMLVCGVVLVSCNPDPAKSSKALGRWSAKWEIKDAPEESYDDGYLVEIEIKDDKTFTGVVSSENVKDTEFSGTWEATSKTTGNITVTKVEKKDWEKALEIGVENQFYCDGSNLLFYSEKEVEAVRFNRVEPN